MNRPIQFAGFLAILATLHATPGITQEETSSGETTATETDAPTGQEVEVNEDNYRRFMELKDARGQRNMLPENAFKPGSGSQKLDKLPEESQKHLRNQLRGIIVRGEGWQPGDEDKQYPFVPSAAAQSDSSLQKQEAEAWGELVDAYHKREAETFASSSSAQGGTSSNAPGGGGSSGNNTGAGGGSTGQGGEGHETSQQARENQANAADSYSPGAANDRDADSTGGVSQNAMEFLKSRGEMLATSGQSGGARDEGPEEGEMLAKTGQSGGTRDGSPENGKQENGNEGDQAQTGGAETASLAGASSESAQPAADTPPENTESRAISEVVDNQKVAGASQNALEYLTGSQQQAQPGEGDTPGQGTGSLPGLSSADEPVESENLQGTLSIEDLLNAQGVRTATGTLPVTKKPDEDPDGQ